MGEAAIEAAITEVVEDAAEQAAEDVRTAAAIEDAAEAVEQAAEHVEDAAARHDVAAATTPDAGDLAQLVRTEVRAAVAEMMPAEAEPITHDHAVEVAEAAAESAVETIVAEAQDAAEGATSDLPGPDDVQLPGDVPEPGEAVTDVADVIDQAADESPRQRHWFHRSLIGGR
jgi:hypothetical protein